MFHRHHYTLLFVASLWAISHAHWPAPFDIRVEHYKVDTTRDLIVNTPRPRFSWKIPVSENGIQSNIQQTAYQLQLQSLQITARDGLFQWDSGRVASSQATHVQYNGPADLSPARYYRFRLRLWITSNAEEPSEWTTWVRFRTPIFHLHEYLTKNSSALWIGSTKINMNELRKEFTVPDTSAITSAIAYISGIGYYSLYVNSNNIDPSRKLDPGWTSYELRTLVVSFDLTSNITAGQNAIGVKLGNGWYSQEQHGEPNYGPPRLLFSMTIRFESGDEMEVVSDQTWTGREGSIKHDSVYNGEFYDSRSDRPDWARPGFSDPLSAWIMPEVMPAPINSSLNGSLVLQEMLPIRAGSEALHFEVQLNSEQQEYLTKKDIGDIQGASLADGGVLKPIATWYSRSDVQTFDLGQNIAGWCRIRFYGRSGSGVYIRHGEVLTQPTLINNRSSANIYTENLRDATASDTYVLRGDPNGEIYEPTFTVHGFRYLAVLDPPREMTMDDVECLVVHSETTLKGHFATSNPIVNQIQHNIVWGQLSNLMSVPTDCTQRDERRGWMGDASLAANQALYNFDLIKFYHNFLNLIVDNQLESGELPNYVPASNSPSNPDWGDNYPADPNWGSALPTITWLIYRHYSDVRTLEIYYGRIVAYIKYTHGVYNTTGLANFTGKYGDWVPPPPYSMSDRHLITSFGFLHDVYLLINMSQVLGKTQDTDFYSRLYQQLTEEFHRVFFNMSSNFYADGMQAAQVLALALPGVVPSNVRTEVIDQLVSDIRQKDTHVTTGIVSTAQLYPVLSDNGHHDLALELISSTAYPSYGYMFSNPYENATTLWELWNTPFADPNMNSRNQAMFSSVGAWFYSHLAGIDLSSGTIIIRPRMASEAKKYLMSKVDCQLSTLHGLVRVSYTRDEQEIGAINSVRLRVTLPPNTRGHVVFEPLFPGARCQTILQRNQVIWSSNTTLLIDQEFNAAKDLATDFITVHIGSGQYEFQALWTQN